MALVDSTLSTALLAIFTEMKAAAATAPKDDKWYADKLAKAFDDQMKTAVVKTTVTIPSTSAPGTISNGTGVGGLS
jgi:hypothetical protein